VRCSRFASIGDVSIRIARPGGIPASAFFSGIVVLLVDFLDVELDEEVLIFTGGDRVGWADGGELSGVGKTRYRRSRYLRTCFEQEFRPARSACARTKSTRSRNPRLSKKGPPVRRSAYAMRTATKAIALSAQ
jgi:hypothetical protein